MFSKVCKGCQSILGQSTLKMGCGVDKIKLNNGNDMKQTLNNFSFSVCNVHFGNLPTFKLNLLSGFGKMWG